MIYDQRSGLYVPESHKDTVKFPPVLSIPDDAKHPSRVEIRADEHHEQRMWTPMYQTVWAKETRQ